MQRVLIACVLAAGVSSLTACIHEAPPPSRTADLRVIATPDTATVYESDHFLGTARLLAKRPKLLKPGIKYLTVKAPGYFPHDLRVDLPAGETTIKIKLRPVPQ